MPRLLDEIRMGMDFSHFHKLIAYLKIGESLIFEPENYENAKFILEKTFRIIGET